MPSSSPACRSVLARSVPALLASLLISSLACGEPQTGSPGLEPPDELDGGGAPGPEGVTDVGNSAAGQGGTTSSGAAGSPSGTPPPVTAADAGRPDEQLADSPSCAPLGEALDALAISQRGESCGTSATPDSGLPNYAGAMIVDLPLTTPLQPGQPYAITLSPPLSGTPGSLEIWGSEQACGPVDELLWYGDMDGRAQCVELMPTRPHSRLQFVARMLDVLQGGFQGGPGDVVLCPGGTCPAGSDGHALAPDARLEPPLGVYDLSCASGYDGYQCEADALGDLLFVDDAGGTASRHPFASGAFRMPPSDPYGDAWYCVGPVSYMLESDDQRRTDVHVEGIGELPACEGGEGSASFAWAHSPIGASDTSAEVTSSDADFAGIASSFRASCAKNMCRFHFGTGTTSTHLYLTIDGDVDAATAPVDLQLLEAAWFSVTEDGKRVRRACAPSGILHYAAVSSVELDAIGDFVECPGTPLPSSTFDLIGE